VKETVKVKYNRERLGKKIVESPNSIAVYDDNARYLGEIYFHGWNNEVHVCRGKGLKVSVDEIPLVE